MTDHSEMLLRSIDRSIVFLFRHQRLTHAGSRQLCMLPTIPQGCGANPRGAVSLRNQVPFCHYTDKLLLLQLLLPLHQYLDFLLLLKLERFWHVQESVVYHLLLTRRVDYDMCQTSSGLNTWPNAKCVHLYFKSAVCSVPSEKKYEPKAFGWVLFARRFCVIEKVEKKDFFKKKAQTATCWQFYGPFWTCHYKQTRF